MLLLKHKQFYEFFFKLRVYKWKRLQFKLAQAVTLLILFWSPSLQYRSA